MTPRSYLYVPGDRPDRFPKAATSAADAVVLDLEDGVATAAKPAAREAVASWLESAPGGPSWWVRVNSAPEHFSADLVALRSVTPDGVYVPKAEPDVLLRFHEQAFGGAALIALVETGTGVLAAFDLARNSRVVRLALGEADLAADLGMDPSSGEPELTPIRVGVVVASAAAGIDPPVGPVFTDFRDLDGLRESTEALRRMGFAGRAAIHPDQVPVINEVLTPPPEEVARARALLAGYEAALAEGRGVFVADDGRMVDEAVARSARRIVERATEE